jgi:Uma2 family endonuclease
MKPITDLSQLDLNGFYSYADYLLWRFEERVELIKGRISKMSPAPNRKHQSVSAHISGLFYNYFLRKTCQYYTAPFDVRLLDKKKSSKANADIFTVVQPDICIICDKTKLDEQGCIGAPDLIVEILSKGNSKKELQTKYELYQESGVKEYWIVFPLDEIVQQFVLNSEEKYELYKVYNTEDTLNAFLFPDLAIDLKEVFSE